MMLVWFGLIYTHLPEKIKSGIDPCSQWGGMDAKPRSHLDEIDEELIADIRWYGC